MKWLHSSAILMFVMAMLFGAYLGTRSWDGTIYVSNGMYNLNIDERTPAAIRRVFDFSHLEGTALTSALQNRLLSDVKTLHAEKGVGIELGHFVTRDDMGDKMFACKYYDRVELSFVADGVIESGEHPTMTVEGSCSFTSNINRIDPIWIPASRILNENPGNLEFTFNPSAEEGSVSVRFRNMGGVWPTTWSLRSIRLYDHDQPDHEVTVGEAEMRKLFSRLISVTL